MEPPLPRCEWPSRQLGVGDRCQTQTRGRTSKGLWITRDAFCPLLCSSATGHVQTDRWHGTPAIRPSSWKLASPIAPQFSSQLEGLRVEARAGSDQGRPDRLAQRCRFRDRLFRPGLSFIRSLAAAAHSCSCQCDPSMCTSGVSVLSKAYGARTRRATLVPSAICNLSESPVSPRARASFKDTSCTCQQHLAKMRKPSCAALSFFHHRHILLHHGSWPTGARASARWRKEAGADKEGCEA
ncbi:hypothetical protein BOTBODRAFT_324298 [Botryobasidium botryosum FD-172 SS1]|uniref:Uncharacterized protein n=1 Tax=Botryobasidium botryosum (strain FD-172 SS1) TaxID=930990 RepID=A0A067NA21_BOTB1|nr:hypothetical protein BOTBODRAFT_324298 [Botryobasidium botryosum FD-172 SS1]